MQLSLIILILLLGGGWGYYGYLRWGHTVVVGIGLSTILLVVLALVYLVGCIR